MSGRKRERSEHTSHKVIEKRRRDRINSCLAELSQAVPSIFAKQTSGKLEKAEILEMTVKYLRVLQRCGIAGRFETGSETKLRDGKYDSTPNQYSAGYHECMKEITRYLTEVEGLSTTDEKYQQIVQFLLSRQETPQTSPQLSPAQDYYSKFTCSSNLVPPPTLRVAHSPPMVALPCCPDSRCSSLKVRESSHQHFQYKFPIEIRAPPELLVSDESSTVQSQQSSPVLFTTEEMLPPLRATPTLWRPFPVNAHAIRHVQRQLFQPRPLCLFGNQIKVEDVTRQAPKSL